MPSSLTSAALQQLFATGDVVLFPHVHAARVWRTRTGDSLAAPPLAWSEWTSSLWSHLVLEGLDDRLLLNRLQEERLWAELIATHAPQQASPSALRDLSTLARSALQQAAAYRMPLHLTAAADTVDAKAFALWLGHFLERSRRDKLLASALLEEALATHLEAGVLHAPPALHLVGFDQPTAAHLYLLEALQQAGTAITHHTLLAGLPGAPPQRRCLEFDDVYQEVHGAVRLLVHEASLQTSTAAEATTPHFALICDNPDDQRPELERLFREQIAPELEAVSSDLSSTPWMFATPAPLSSLPAIADGLDLLRWIASPLPVERIAQLLVSPAFAFADTPESRARFDLATRRVPALRGTLDLAEFTKALLASAESPSAEGRAAFAELRAAAASAASPSRARPADQWSEWVRSTLHLVGWPGSRIANASDFRAMQAWDGLLDALATLNATGPAVTLSTYLNLLSSEARSSPVSAARVDAPIQVLTPGEAQGLFFDLAIYLDATEARLPGSGRPHPLLPQGLQRSLGVADAATLLQQARQSLSHLAERSTRLILLAPREGASGEQEGLTPLATELNFLPLTQADREETVAEDFPVPTEAILDPASLPLAASENTRGGSDILSQQAACGFRAFASYRLGAREDAPAQIGVPARESGNLLHTALQFIWEQLGSQQALRALTIQARQDLVQTAASTAMQKHHLRAPAEDRWSRSYLRILRTRFVHLLDHWLDHELKRDPFTIHSLEEQQELTLGPLRLKLRTDRIDDVAGGQVFVDYKSSSSLSSQHWLGNRPDAPQLPAYALGADPDALRDITFARVRPGEQMGWISLTGATGHAPKAKKSIDLPAQLAIWHDELTSLAQDFFDGRATVNPKSYPQTCTYCAHRLLCRLNPATLLDQDDDNDRPEEDARG